MPRSSTSTTFAALGISHVELMPVAEFPGRCGWGYDGVDLFAPHHAYGGPDGLKRLVDAAHGRGLAVILDVVYNHFGPDGKLPGPSSGRTSPTGTGRPGGRGQPRRPGQRRGPALPDRQRADVAARLPPRRAAARRGPRAVGSHGHPLPRATRRGGRGAGAAARPAADPHRGERPQRPAPPARREQKAATAWTPSGATTSTTRCT